MESVHLTDNDKLTQFFFISLWMDDVCIRSCMFMLFFVGVLHKWLNMVVSGNVCFNELDCEINSFITFARSRYFTSSLLIHIHPVQISRTTLKANMSSSVCDLFECSLRVRFCDELVSIVYLQQLMMEARLILEFPGTVWYWESWVVHGSHLYWQYSQCHRCS